MATYDKDEFIRTDFSIVCKYCKKSGFEWYKYNGVYRLIDCTGKIHFCSDVNRITKSDKLVRTSNNK